MIALHVAPAGLIANIPPNIDWSVFESFDPAPIINLLRPIDEITFEKELMKCIGYWASRLAWDSKGVVSEQDLRGVFGLKLFELYPKLHEVFSNMKVFRKYIAVVCQNEYKDHLASHFTQKNNVAMTSSTEFEIPDSEGGFVKMIDLLQTDDVGEVFTLQDIKQMVTAEEYRIVLDYFVAGTSLRELVAEDGGSKSKLGRVTKELKLKLAGYLQNRTPMMRSSTRPDRIRPDVVEGWNGRNGIDIQPFFVCEHLRAAVMVVGSQPLVDFALVGAAHVTDRYGLCAACWRWYWMDLMGKLQARIKYFEESED
jgi:hypothetical protein